MDSRRPPGDGSISDKIAPISYSAQNPSASPKAGALPRSRIIRRRIVFDATRNQGRRVSNRYLALNYLSREAIPPGETGTVAFLTPKRLGSATVRNRLRRQMREIYRREWAQSDENRYLVWIARPTALELDFEGLKRTMLALRSRMGPPAS